MVDNSDILKDLSVGEQLGRVGRLWKAVANQELVPLGLTYSRWSALWKLKRFGDHISQKSLAELLEIELGSLMRTLKQLEEQGLIERHSCKDDKRARIVSLTPAGKEVLKTIEVKVMQARRYMLADIDIEELNQLTRTLEKIAHNALDTLKSDQLKEGKKG